MICDLGFILARLQTGPPPNTRILRYYQGTRGGTRGTRGGTRGTRGGTQGTRAGTRGARFPENSDPGCCARLPSAAGLAGCTDGAERSVPLPIGSCSPRSGLGDALPRHQHRPWPTQTAMHAFHKAVGRSNRMIGRWPRAPDELTRVATSKLTPARKTRGMGKGKAIGGAGHPASRGRRIQNKKTHPGPSKSGCQGGWKAGTHSTSKGRSVGLGGCRCVQLVPNEGPEGCQHKGLDCDGRTPSRRSTPRAVLTIRPGSPSNPRTSDNRPRICLQTSRNASPSSMAAAPAQPNSLNP